MIEFESGQSRYRAEKLDAFQQFHVSRKIAPLIPPLIPVMLDLNKGTKESKAPVHIDLSTLPGLIQPFANGLAALDNESAEYIISTCLSVIKRNTVNDHWAKIWNSSANRVMFEDLNNLSEMIPLVVYVIRDSLGPFIQGLMSASPIPLAKTAA